MPELPRTPTAPQCREFLSAGWLSRVRSTLSGHGSVSTHLNLPASQDHDFLENEQFFLETLKKAPYNMAYHSA